MKNYDEFTLRFLLSTSKINESIKERIQTLFEENTINDFINNEFILHVITKAEERNLFIEEIPVYLYWYKNKNKLGIKTLNFIDSRVGRINKSCILTIVKYLNKSNNIKNINIINDIISENGPISVSYVQYLLYDIIPNIDKDKLDICLKYQVFKKIRLKKCQELFEFSKKSNNRDFERYIKKLS